MAANSAKRERRPSAAVLKLRHLHCAAKLGPMNPTVVGELTGRPGVAFRAVAGWGKLTGKVEYARYVRQESRH